MNEEPTALQVVLLEITNAGIVNPRGSRLWAAIRWLVAESAYARIGETTSAAGTALTNMRREAAHWKGLYESTPEEFSKG